MKRTIKNLSKMDGRVYVYLPNDEIGNNFMVTAESEGFTFGDGVLPTKRNYAGIMAVNEDMTINYVGANGRIAFGAGAKGITRIDYKKYADGAENYFYKKSVYENRARVKDNT